MSALNPEVSDEADGEQPAEVDVVCIFPTASEAGGLVDKLSSVKASTCNGFVERTGTLNETRIAVIESTLQDEAFARCIRDVLVLRKPQWAIAGGFAMAVDNRTRRGEIVVADHIIDRRDYSLSTGTRMAESKGLRVGPMLTVDMFPSEPDKQQELAATKAIACDTQASVVAEVCRVLKVKMMAIHVVAKRQSATSSLMKQVKSQESIAGLIGAAAGAIIENPGTVKEFWNDKEDALKLSDRLAAFLEGVIRQLK